MINNFCVQTKCERCGMLNEFQMKLLSVHEGQTYKCSICNYILLISWLTEEEKDE